MSNVAGKAYGMNVVTPMRPHRTWINRLLFMASRAIPSTLGGLLGLSIIHFARWVIIKRDQWPDLGQGKSLQNCPAGRAGRGRTLGASASRPKHEKARD